MIDTDDIAKQSHSGPLPAPASQADRVAFARSTLVKFGVSSGDPKWSSATLDDLVDAIMRLPGGSVADVFRALNEVLREYKGDLKSSLANFTKDLIVKCFTHYPESYQAVDWHWFIQILGMDATKAQHYFALHAIPDQFIPTELSRTIRTELESTALRDEVNRFSAA